MESGKTISCVSDYISIITELNNSYTTHGMKNNPYVCKFLYRGICNKAFKLIPAMLRETYDYDITICRSLKNKKYQISEKEILRNFIGQACAYIKEDPTLNLYKWAEYAQHYGVPTRFLDWTENPLVALYFACKDDKPDYQQTENEDEVGGKDAAVWMVHQHNYRKFALQGAGFRDQKDKLPMFEIINKIYENDISFDYPLIYRPYYTDLRMSAQSSMLMVWGKKELSFSDFFTSDNWMRSNKKMDNSRSYGKNQNNEMIFDFHIASDRKQSILRELDLYGVNEKTLFPGLDGIGRYTEMKYRCDLEELKESI